MSSASSGLPKVVGPGLERELEGERWMYPWRFTESVRARLLSPWLPDIHRTRAQMIEGPVRSALAAAGPAATAIDLACCEGWFSHRLLEWGAQRVIAVDIRETNIRRAELIRDHFGIDPGRLSFRQADVLDLGNADLGQADVVLVLGLVYHLEDPARAMRIARHLTRSLCVIESQLTRQSRPLVCSYGSPQALCQTRASFAAVIEPDASANSTASSPGVISLIPNRAALELLAVTAGFGDVQFLKPAPGHEAQYLRGDRAILLATS